MTKPKNTQGFNRDAIRELKQLKLAIGERRGLTLRPQSFSLCLSYIRELKVPFIWRKVVPGKRVTLLAESTLPSIYMRKKLTPLPELAFQ